MKLLENKNLFITGGSKGIGKAIIELFAQQGANIAFTSRKKVLPSIIYWNRLNYKM